jgi:hypothetical protein
LGTRKSDYSFCVYSPCFAGTIVCLVNVYWLIER